MTENEAVEALRLSGGLEISGRPRRCAEFFEGLDIAIKALEEIQQYREIGTVEECRAAMERQRIQKPKLYGDYEDGKLLCPNCENDLMDLVECGFNCCPYCGQAIDWRVFENL